MANPENNNLFTNQNRQSPRPLILSYGMGVYSTALIVHWHKTGTRPDLILYADVGSERLQTTQHRPVIDAYLHEIGFPAIVTVKYQPKHNHYQSLITETLLKGMLPSIAYGRKACSINLNRKRCIEEIQKDEILKSIGQKLGIPHVPPKSACMMYPSTKPEEIIEMGLHAGDKLTPSLAVEENARANNRVVEELWRRSTKTKPGSWPEFVAENQDLRTLDLPDIHPLLETMFQKSTNDSLSNKNHPSARFALVSENNIEYVEKFGDAKNLVKSGAEMNVLISGR